jgi:hypothetical protein
MSTTIHKIIFIILIFTFLPIVISQSLDKIFVLDIYIYRNDSTAKLVDFKLTEGVPQSFPEPPPEFNYTLTIYSVDNQILFQKPIIVGFLVSIFPEGEKLLDEVFLRLRIPYFENAKRIDIYRNNKKIFSYEICYINGVCDSSKGENSVNCPEDCKPKTVCGNKICEVGETKENCCKDCGCPSGYTCIENKCIKTTSPLIYLIPVLIIATLVIIIILKSKRAYEISS